ncbi:MAG: hypothetical protein J6T51_04210 [Kiritimatiellae bacterium]|nr:hypothetical protein [Kiritimatiellia bacterium]
MKAIHCVILPLVVSGVAVAGVAVGPLPVPEYDDAEVSTNFPFAVGEGQGRGIVFTVELQATPSNNVEIAIGCDADEDGRLSVDEFELCVGYDCGTWFVRSSAQGAVTAEDVDDSSDFRRVYRVRARSVNPLWNLVKVTRRGYGAATERVLVEMIEHGFKVRLL